MTTPEHFTKDVLYNRIDIREGLFDLVIGNVQSGKTKVLLGHSHKIVKEGMVSIIITRNYSADASQIINRIGKQQSDGSWDGFNSNITDGNNLITTKLTSKVNTLTNVMVLLGNYAQLEHCIHLVQQYSDTNFCISIDEVDLFAGEHNKSETRMIELLHQPNIYHILGVTATPMATFMTIKDWKKHPNRIYKLDPHPLYVGVTSDRIVRKNVEPVKSRKRNKNNRDVLEERKELDIISNILKECKSRKFCISLILSTINNDNQQDLLCDIINKHEDWVGMIFNQNNVQIVSTKPRISTVVRDDKLVINPDGSYLGLDVTKNQDNPICMKESPNQSQKMKLSKSINTLQPKQVGQVVSNIRGMDPEALDKNSEPGTSLELNAVLDKLAIDFNRMKESQNPSPKSISGKSGRPKRDREIVVRTPKGDLLINVQDVKYKNLGCLPIALQYLKNMGIKKIVIVAGKKADRGISFVDEDYTNKLFLDGEEVLPYHLTDLYIRSDITVKKSGAKSLDKNIHCESLIQKMRILGIYHEDDKDNLYLWATPQLHSEIFKCYKEIEYFQNSLTKITDSGKIMDSLESWQKELDEIQLPLAKAPKVLSTKKKHEIKKWKRIETQLEDTGIIYDPITKGWCYKEEDRDTVQTNPCEYNNCSDVLAKVNDIIYNLSIKLPDKFSNTKPLHQITYYIPNIITEDIVKTGLATRREQYLEDGQLKSLAKDKLFQLVSDPNFKQYDKSNVFSQIEPSELYKVKAMFSNSNYQIRNRKYQLLNTSGGGEAQYLKDGVYMNEVRGKYKSPLYFRYGNYKTKSNDTCPILLDINFTEDFKITKRDGTDQIIRTNIKDGHLIWWQNLFGKVFVDTVPPTDSETAESMSNSNTRIIQLNSVKRPSIFISMNPKKTRKLVSQKAKTPTSLHIIATKKYNKKSVQPRIKKKTVSAASPTKPVTKKYKKIDTPHQKHEHKKTVSVISSRANESIVSKNNRLSSRFFRQFRDSDNPFTNPNHLIKDVFNEKIIPAIIRILLSIKPREILDFILCDNKLNTVSKLHTILNPLELSKIKFIIIEIEKGSYEYQLEESKKYNNVEVLQGDLKKTIQSIDSNNKFIYADTCGSEKDLGDDPYKGSWPLYHENLIKQNVTKTKIILGTYSLHAGHPKSHLARNIMQNKTVTYEYGIGTIMKTYISINQDLFYNWFDEYRPFDPFSNSRIIDSIDKENIIEYKIPGYKDIDKINLRQLQDNPVWKMKKNAQTNNISYINVFTGISQKEKPEDLY